MLTGATAEEAIILAANLGGDADTVASAAGGIAGALWGFEALPGRWVGALGDGGVAASRSVRFLKNARGILGDGGEGDGHSDEDASRHV